MFDVVFSEHAFFEGGSLSSLVPSIYYHAIDGHPFMVDTGQDGDGRFRHQSIPLLKQQQQTDGSLGARSINPAGYWRVAVESWHRGAGQTNFDLDESDPYRFRESKGVDVWTKWELSLLPDTDQKRTSSNTNLTLLPVGSYLYLIDGTALLYTQDGTVDAPSWTSVTGTPGNTLLSVATDGYNVYATDGANIYQGTRGASSVSSWSTYDSDLLGYVKGRLMSAHDNVVSNITGSAAKTDVVTHPNTDFRWVGFAEGRNCIYMAGYSGDKSLIYRTAVEADGTSLDVGQVAGELPDGEIVRSIYGYLGFLCIGTDQGVRFAQQDDAGDLTIGALIELGVSVRCFEGQGSFVWFGWSNYDSASTGLGRLSLTSINDGAAPAYASDLMATAQGNVLSVVTFGGRRYFTVSAAGVWGEEDDLVSTGSLDSGLISFGIPDNKVALGFDLRHRPLEGSVVIYADANEADSFAALGTSAIRNRTGESWSVGEITGEKFELRTELNRSSTDTTAGPTVTREVFKMNPTADTGYEIVLPVLLAPTENPPGNPASPRNRDVDGELQFLKSLRASRDVVVYQEGSRLYSVSLEDYVWLPGDAIQNGAAFQGTAILRLKVV